MNKMIITELPSEDTDHSNNKVVRYLYYAAPCPQIYEFKKIQKKPFYWNLINKKKLKKMGMPNI